MTLGNFEVGGWGRAKLNVVAGIQWQTALWKSSSPSVIGITVVISKLLEPWIALNTQHH